MSRNRSLGVAAIAAVAMAALGGCGSTASKGANASDGPPTLTVVEAGAPDSLDPQVGQTTLSTEATWNVYLGLYTYAHANGTAGTKVIPALASSLPRVSDGGTRYTVTLRKGLTFSNRQPVKASDFAHAVERAIKLNWEGKGFFTEHIAGAEAFDKGKASSISGIAADNSTGTITITLSAPYGAFVNVLAFPAAGLVPASTPMKAMPNDPPPGVGPYTIENVSPGQSFEERINPHWASEAIPGIPTPKANIEVKVQSNAGGRAQEVLEGPADLYDWNTPLPPSAAAQAKSQAADRYSVEPIAQVGYFFLNVSKPPFNSPLARRAVVEALNRPAFVRLSSGYLTPGCYLVPPGLIGHPSSPCPYGNPASTGDVAKAKQLVAQSGTAGQQVTVWAPGDSPQREYADTFAQILDSIGYDAKEKTISVETYYPTVANPKTGAQSGFAEYTEDFPDPSDFYQLVDGELDLSRAEDKTIEREVSALSQIPASQLSSVAGRWEALERHTAREAYAAVIGYQDAPKLTSSRVDFGALVFSPVYGSDWATLKLK